MDSSRAGAGQKLKARETLLDRSDAPARIGAELFHPFPGIVQRTDVTQLHRATVPLFDPAERKPLGPADVWALIVNPTGAMLVEKRASALRVRRARGQELGVMGANVLRFDLEHRQTIDTARATAFPALQLRLVQNVQAADLASDLGVQRDDRVESGAADAARASAHGRYHTPREHQAHRRLRPRTPNERRPRPLRPWDKEILEDCFRMEFMVATLPDEIWTGRLPRRALRAALGALCLGAVAAPGCGAAPSEVAGSTSEPIVSGAGAVTINTADQVVNRYTSLSANAAVGATTVTVGSGAALGAVANGDLLMIIQMQGATIDTTNTATYGAVTALSGAGVYELVTVTSVSGNVVTFNAACGLKNAYSAAAHTQVIWVPQYQTLTVSGAGSITAPAWDGSVGGVVAIQAGTASLQSAGAISVAGVGFRGGVVKQQTTLPITGAPAFVSNVNTAAAEKGESIAGYHTEYDADNGRYGIGAPANGGGGGGPHNSGGGGGANGNDGNAWSGTGVMPAGVTGAAAWALDPEDVANGGARPISSGGGRGGYSYSATARDPLVVAPGDALWTGDDRQQHGGRGGRPLANSPLSQIFLGGGGGAGESNNGAGTDGAAGGGLAYLIANTVDGAGTGSIVADGATAQTTATSGGLNGNDAPGGGGGGGTVVLLASSVTTLAVSANGGGGGLQNITIPPEAEGPGGGGGGGFIAAPAAFAAGVPAGGAGGTTNSNGVTNFPRNGSTDGATGQTAALAAGAQAPLCIATDLALTMSDGGGNATPGTAVTYTIVVTNNGPNPATGATVMDTFSGQFTGETWTCAGSACPAASGSGNLNGVLGALAPSAKATFTVAATVATNASGTSSNTATVTPPAGIVDPDLANNTATDSNPLVGSANLAVALTSAPASVVVKTAYSYTISVSNSGPSDATTLSTGLSIPSGATFQSAAGSGWACSFAAPNVTCTRATLAAGASAPITVDVTAPATPGPGAAVATVSAATADPTPGNNTATDTIDFPCGLDTDCPANQWCSQGACTPRIANGQPLPGVSPINGQCNPANGARVCLTGACDANGNVCGIKLGDGTCASTAQCTAGFCIATGANADRCEACALDTNCAAPTPACDMTTNACVQCTPGDTTACTGTTPVCSAGETCVPCNGDNGTGATNACPGMTPYCASTGACVLCTANSMCTTGTHAGSLCNTTSGACITSCQNDAECGGGKWCNNLSGPGVCQAQVPNGQSVPGGTCTMTIGARACVSAACDDSDNLCGIKNGDGPCTGGRARSCVDPRIARPRDPTRICASNATRRSTARTTKSAIRPPIPAGRRRRMPAPRTARRATAERETARRPAFPMRAVRPSTRGGATARRSAFPMRAVRPSIRERPWGTRPPTRDRSKAGAVPALQRARLTATRRDGSSRFSGPDCC